MVRNPRVVFAGGGSGGHLVPGILLARELRRLTGGGGRFLFLRGRRRNESLVQDPAPGETRILKGLTTPSGLLGRTRFAITLPALFARSFQVLRRFQADTVIGLGGYGALPTVLAARALGLRILLLEQNARPGLANRLLGPFAHAVCCAFSRTAEEFINGRLTGNPVFQDPQDLDRGVALKRFGFSPDRLTLLVMGGSQGARGLNDLVLNHLSFLSPLADSLQILHITGEADRERSMVAYRRYGLTARAESFLPDMPMAYCVADVVVSRAGGTSLAEVAAAGLPSVLVPYPYHRDRHQYANARVFLEAGAAFLLPEEEGNAAAFVGTVGALLGDAALREAMGRSAATLSRPGAALHIAELLMAPDFQGGEAGTEPIRPDSGGV